MKGLTAMLVCALLVAFGTLVAGCGDDGGESPFLPDRQPTVDAGGEPTVDADGEPTVDNGGEPKLDTGGELTAEEYFAALKKLIDEGNVRMGTLEDDFSGVWQEQAATQDALEEIDAYIEGALGRLDELGPPDGVEQAHDEFREAAAAQRRLFQEIAGAVGEAQSTSVAEVVVLQAGRMEEVNRRLGAACLVLQGLASERAIEVDLECADQ